MLNVCMLYFYSIQFYVFAIIIRILMIVVSRTILVYLLRDYMPFSLFCSQTPPTFVTQYNQNACNITCSLPETVIYYALVR